VVNLLANAIKFAPGGEVALSAETVEAKGIEIRIADTGCGIPPDQLDQAPLDSAIGRGTTAILPGPGCFARRLVGGPVRFSLSI
jgi:anti-sigma regulatory factor (Ser/Thr protein kinase)